MAKLHSTPAMLAITVGLTLATILLVNLAGESGTENVATPNESGKSVVQTPGDTAGVLSSTPAHAQENGLPAPKWAASATGRIETITGEVRLVALEPRQIVDVRVDTNDKVKKGDPLVVLDDEDLYAKRQSALAEVEVRLRERAEEPETGLAKDRQNSEDQVADAERELFDARMHLDRVLKTDSETSANEESVNKARERLQKAEDAVDTERAAYQRVIDNKDMPKPTRLDTGLIQSRADLLLVEHAIDQTRVRAPFDGDVLNVWANAGEIAAPSAATPLILFGDKSQMRVRAELEERDLVHVRVGQKVIIRSDAHPGKDFVGKVTSMGGALGTRAIATRGPRRPSDVDVLEVIAELGEQPLLLPGMRVDVFFANDETAQAGAK